MCVLLVCVPVSVERNDQGSYSYFRHSRPRLFHNTNLVFGSNERRSVGKILRIF